ncbi:hypothetical protein BH20VER1_BH20VER1_22300 [soil metagenome]
MKRFITLAAALAAFTAATPAFAQLWDNGAQGNGTLITHPNGMTGAAAGAHRSAISTPGSSTFGSGAAGTIRLADNFTVTGLGWNISSFQFFGYLTGATTPGATALTLRIWDNTPGAAGSNIIFGDTTTNVLTSTGWAAGPGGAGIYRTTGTDTTGTTRRVQELTANVNLTLGPGTYWVDFSYTGVSFTPPLSAVGGLPPAGDAVQLTAGGWGPALDNGGAGPQLDFPFIIQGTVIPEPGTYALLVVGGLAMVAAARRRRRAN